MSKPRPAFSPLTRIIIVIWIGALSLVFEFSIFVIIPVLIYYVWDDYDKRKELERRVTELENGRKTNPPPA